ncbi:MAG: NAD-dependent malic enzyme [Burkholderiaceae bacterium]
MSHRQLPQGVAVLRDPVLNKGTAFSDAERDRLKLRGLLPPRRISQSQQVARVVENLRALAKPLNRYVALEALHDRNESLYYRVVIDHIEEMMPIIYTPTVGLACQEFDQIFRRPRGVYVSANDRGHVAELLANHPIEDVDIIVVTDGERILGLGDLGANGMGIPIGKLSLYTACAGIDPARALPVLIDVGTNNLELREHPLYLGLPQARVTGADYDELVDEFITAARARWPNVLIQFEDFANHHAFDLLDRWRDRIPCFNDDIQGTAAVALAGFLSALRVTGQPLAEQRVLFLGAGEAATGIADLITAALVDDGLTEAEARQRAWLFDSKGLVTADRTGLTAHKLAYAHPHASAKTFLEAVELLKPTAIVGVAAAAGAFDAEVLSAMARINQRPIVFALSNPTSKAECTAHDAYTHTEGRALFASGSPFDHLEVHGKRFVPRQANNAYVFPGLGLGVIASRASAMPDEMFLAAARMLAQEVTEDDLAAGSLLPALTEVRAVSARIAVAVAELAYERGLAQRERPANLLASVREGMFDANYQSLA